MLTHLKRNAVAYAALFVALGGTSYAAVKLPAGSVGTKELHHGAVTKTKLHRDAVTSTIVRDHTLKVVDFARGQLTAGAKGDKGEKGDTGAKGDPGPTFGVAGLDTGCCPSPTPTAAATVASTKTVTLDTRARLLVLGSTRAAIYGCSSGICTVTWGLRIDGAPIDGSARGLQSSNGDEHDVLTPFGVTAPLDPGTHTIALGKEPTSGTVTSTSFGGQHIAAVALGV